MVPHVALVCGGRTREMGSTELWGEAGDGSEFVAFIKG